MFETLDYTIRIGTDHFIFLFATPKYRVCLYDRKIIPFALVVYELKLIHTYKLTIL